MNDDIPPEQDMRPPYKRTLGKHVKEFVKNRAAGMNEYDALEKAGLPRRKSLLRGLQGNQTVQTAIIRKARQGVDIVKLVEQTRGRLHDFINDRELDPDIVLKAIDVFYRSLLNSGVLTLNERATLEQNPETRVDLARQVLAQLREAGMPAPEMKTIEVEPVEIEPQPQPEKGVP